MMRLFRATAVSVLLLAGCDGTGLISDPVLEPAANHVPGEPPTVHSVGVPVNGSLATVIWHVDPFNMGEGYTVQVYAGTTCTGTNLVPGGSNVAGTAWTQPYHLYVNVGPLAAGGHCARVKSNGLFSPPSFTTFVTVLFTVGSSNTPPEAGFVQAPAAALEGDTIIFTGIASDADGDSLGFEWSIDGEVASTGPALSHVFEEDGLYEVSFAVRDGKGGVSTSTRSVGVENVAPAMIAAATSDALVVPAGVALQIAGTFSDPGSLDTHVLELDCNWSGTALEGAGATAVNPDWSGSCTWPVAGTYRIRLAIRDDDGGSDSLVSDPIVVYQPGVGHVTGGGWIESPVDACQLTPECGDAAVKASFGFVSRYVKGAALPAGSVTFQLTAGSLTFKSASQLWLAVSGPVARFGGRGTIDGVGNYDFVVTAVDGREDGVPDRFRIRIRDHESGAVVYDNRAGESPSGDAGTDLSDGSIVIHRVTS